MRRVLAAPLVALLALGFLLGGSVGFAASVALSPKRLVVFTSASSVPISSCTLTALADTYADGAALAAGSNFGTGTQLHVRSDSLGNKRSFVRFDLASCVPGGARVETATLSLFLGSAPASARTYQARRVTASWGETTLTWNNQPGAAGSATDSVSTGTTSNVTLSWSVAADVQAFADGAADNGWRIADATEGALLGVEGRFSAREHGTASQRPSLTITYYP